MSILGFQSEFFRFFQIIEDDWRRSSQYIYKAKERERERAPANVFNHFPFANLNRIFNTGSPFNVPAGSQVNLDKVIAHYKKQNAAVDAAREARTKAAANNPKPKEPYIGWAGGG